MGINQFPEPSAQSSGEEILDSVDVVTSTGTWTHPKGASTENPKRIVAVIIGGGGGGGGVIGYNANQASTPSHGSGGGGGYYKVVDAIITSSQSVTIGSGGSAGSGFPYAGTVPSTQAGSGGQTSFSDISASGGTGGIAGGVPSAYPAPVAAGGGGASKGSDKIANYIRNAYSSIISNPAFANNITGANFIIDQSNFSATSVQEEKIKGVNAAGSPSLRNPAIPVSTPGFFGSGGAGGSINSLTGSPGTGYGGGGGGGSATYGPTNQLQNAGYPGGAGSSGAVVIFYSSK